MTAGNDWQWRSLRAAMRASLPGSVVDSPAWHQEEDVQLESAGRNQLLYSQCRRNGQYWRA